MIVLISSSLVIIASVLSPSWSQSYSWRTNRWILIWCREPRGELSSDENSSIVFSGVDKMRSNFFEDHKSSLKPRRLRKQRSRKERRALGQGSTMKYTDKIHWRYTLMEYTDEIHWKWQGLDARINHFFLGLSGVNNKFTLTMTIIIKEWECRSHWMS